MKTTIKTTCFFLLIFSITNTYAQSGKNIFPEKLTLLFNNDIKIVIESREILNIPKDEKQNTLFRYLLTDINKLQDSLHKLNAPLVISYHLINENTRRIRINNNTDAKAEFILTGNSDTISSNFFNYRIECNLDKNNMLVLYTNKLSTLSSLNDISFTNIIQQAQSDISARKISDYKAKTCLYKVRNNNLDLANADIKKQGGTLIMAGGMDFGVSYFNDRFISNISASMAYVFSPKSYTRSILGVSFNAYANMDTSKSYSMQGNYFIDVFYNKKFPDHPFFYATDMKLFIGYLVRREGDVFQKNTWRFGLDMPAGKNFRIIYVVYINSLKNDRGLFEIGIRYKLF